MSTDTLRLEGKPGTGKVAPGKVTPLKSVKAKPELTQQLKVSQATPHTPDIPEWKGAFPFPKNIEYLDKVKEKLIADLSMKITPKPWTCPGDSWGHIRAMAGTSNAPKFHADVEERDGSYRLWNATYQLDLEFAIVFYDSPSWESDWGEGMEKLTGRPGVSLQERKYWVFQHEMDHFLAWNHYFLFMLRKIFTALNTEFEVEEQAYTRISEINYNSVENFLIATSRSHAFDELRGAPLRGGKYADFYFPPTEQYKWEDSGNLEPMNSSVVFNEIQRIKNRDLAK